jgi:hypothetical protein
MEVKIIPDTAGNVILVRRLLICDEEQIHGPKIS